MILEIVSPEARLFSGEVTSVTLPGVDGSFQILNNHAPIVSILEKGIIKIAAPSFNFSKEAASKFTKVNDQTYTLQIVSGTIEMKDNKIIVLAD
jgi:F-type H+-transporting ATPase subunit epsilon